MTRGWFIRWELETIFAALQTLYLRGSVPRAPQSVRIACGDHNKMKILELNRQILRATGVLPKRPIIFWFWVAGLYQTVFAAIAYLVQNIHDIKEFSGTVYLIAPVAMVVDNVVSLFQQSHRIDKIFKTFQKIVDASESVLDKSMKQFRRGFLRFRTIFG